MSALQLSNVSVVRQNVEILRDVSFTVPAGQMVGLLGPNGAGKTTAVRALLGLQDITSGQATLGGTDTKNLNPRQRARAISYLPQTRKMAWPIGVREAVALGRFAYGNPMGHLSDLDQRAVDDAIARCDLTALKDRSVASLSGGELARVHIARALAGGAPALISDEPTNALDPRHSLEILALLKVRTQEGSAILVILHDLRAAAQFCDQIILLDQGKLVAQGTPREVLSSERLAQVYQIRATWDDDDLKIIAPL
jgi:iron complex transport system ATP-binding protein